MPRSVRMRASTGNAVTDIAAPRKSANGSRPVDVVVGRPARGPAPTPSPNGSRIEPTRDGDGDPLLAAHQRVVELVADDEHEQHQAEVGQPGQRPADVDREQRVADHRAEQGRPDQDPGQDLADDRRLADPPRQGAEQAGEHDDDGETPAA